MNKIIITKGLPGCGKTTWAKRLMQDQPGKFKRINKDELRSMIDNGYYTSQNEVYINTLRDHMIIKFLSLGFDIIIDDTNLNPTHITQIEQIPSLFIPMGIHVELEIKDFTFIPIETCIAQDLMRSNPVGEKVIRDMAEKYLNHDSNQ